MSSVSAETRSTFRKQLEQLAHVLICYATIEGAVINALFGALNIRRYALFLPIVLPPRPV